jgi:transposase
MLDHGFTMQEQTLDAVNATLRPQPVPLSDGTLAGLVPPHDISLPAQQRAAERQARRPALHPQVWALHRQGWTAPAIAQHVGLGRRTVQRALPSATLAGRKRRSDLGESGLNPSKPYVRNRWNAGGHTARQRLRARPPQGDAGS